MYVAKEQCPPLGALKSQRAEETVAFQGGKMGRNAIDRPLMSPQINQSAYCGVS